MHTTACLINAYLTLMHSLLRSRYSYIQFLNYSFAYVVVLTLQSWEIGKATLHSVVENVPFVVECDASDIAVVKSIWTRSGWSHFRARQHFTLITDQRSVAFVVDNRERTKIKNNKISVGDLN